MAARVIVVVTSGSCDETSQLTVGVVGAFGVGQVFGAVIRCVWRDVADRRGDRLGVVDVGWGGEGREGFAGSRGKVC